MEAAHFDGRLPTGPKVAKSTVLSIEGEAVIIAFRRHMLLPVDDCLYFSSPDAETIAIFCCG